MTAKPADPMAHFLDMVGRAVSGDPVMLRDLAATLGAFSVRLLVAGLIFTVTLWVAKRLAAVTQGASSGSVVITPTIRRSAPLWRPS